MRANIQDVSDSFVKRSYGILDLIKLTYPQFINILEEANVLSRKLKRPPENISYHFEIDGNSDRNPLLWKVFIRILCFKLLNDSLILPVERIMKLKEFLLVFADLKTLNSAILTGVRDDCQSADHDTRSELIPADQMASPDSALSSSEKNKTPLSQITKGDCHTQQDPCSSSSTPPVHDKLEKRKTYETEECIICLERQSDITLPCAHSYCTICIKKWLMQHLFEDGRSCPLCRGYIGTEENAWQLINAPDIKECERDLQDMVIQRLKRHGKCNAQSN